MNTYYGLTYEDFIKAGWTDKQLLTFDGGKYAYLLPSCEEREDPSPTTIFKNARGAVRLTLTVISEKNEAPFRLTAWNGLAIAMATIAKLGSVICCETFTSMYKTHIARAGTTINFLAPAFQINPYRTIIVDGKKLSYDRCIICERPLKQQEFIGHVCRKYNPLTINTLHAVKVGV